MKINNINTPLVGKIKVPGDKSISHRSVMLGAISEGETIIENFLMGEDCLDTIKCFRNLGVNISIDKEVITVKGVGLKGFKNPNKTLYAGNSGTTIRLMTGILAGQNFKTIISGDESLSKRPMDRITNPLSIMGADINCKDDLYPPIEIKPVSRLKGIKYLQPKASAQVKSAILFAGLYTDEDIHIIQPEISRDHTERMMKYFGANINITGKEVLMKGKRNSLKGKKIFVPGDISSAAFYIVAASIIKDSHIVIKDVGINPTRTGIIDIMNMMGGNINILNKRVMNEEEVGDIEVKYSQLKGINIDGEIIPRIIDEIPIIALASSYAKGETVIRGAEELKVKESNRIDAVSVELNKLGASIKATDDGMIIQGERTLIGNEVDSRGDHRIAMMLAVAGLKAKGTTNIKRFDSVNVSNPNFIQLFNSLKDI
jgi:3-phosphoshikimate 1-carboxyvinyltransferase